MAAIPARVANRMGAGLKRFQPILAAARTRDVNESDTVVIVTDLLQEIFGYDKYSEITSEHMIRGTFVDLAIKIDAALQLLIEVKAIGLDLKDSHVKQSVDYAANHGVEWVALTNGVTWRVYKVFFKKPIEHELVLEFNLCELNHRNQDHLELLWLLAKESWQKARLGEYHSQKQALSRFSLAALILSEPVLDVIRRELRRNSPGVKIELEEIQEAIRNDVLKREVLEGEQAELARKQIARASKRTLRSAKSRPNSVEECPTPSADAKIEPTEDKEE